MAAQSGPMTKERIAAMKEAAKSLGGKVNANYETTAGNLINNQAFFSIFSMALFPLNCTIDFP